MEGATPVGAKKEPTSEAPKNFLQRFLVPTAKPVTNGGSGNGVVDPVSRREQRWGLFRRKAAPVAAPAPARVDSRALAPKPGVKPVHPRQGGGEPRSGHGAARPRDNGVGPDDHESLDSRGSDSPGLDSQRADSRRSAARGPAASGDGTGGAVPPAGADPDIVRPAAAAKPTSKQPTSKQPAGGRSGGAKRTSGNARKRASNRKGGHKR
jgi:hypothetical protein